jgi:hypothetical protein
VDSGPKKNQPSKPVPTAPKDPPFDLAAASAAVNQAVSTAKFFCKNSDGPLAFSGNAHFSNAGNVQRSDFNDIQGSSTARGLCVRMRVGSARIKAFSGAAKPVPFAVSF